MPAPIVTKAAIQRTIEAAKAAGLIPTAVIVSKDGTVRVETMAQETVDTQTDNDHALKAKKWAKR